MKIQSKITDLKVTHKHVSRVREQNILGVDRYFLNKM